MELLTSILRESVDPDYAAATQAAAASGRPPRRHPLAVLLTCLLAGLLLATSAVNTLRGAPDQQAERADLISRIDQAKQDQAAQRDQIAVLSRQVADLQAALGADPADSPQLSMLNSLTGAGAVTGPGVVITLRDAGRTDQQGIITDQDLRQVVNGLWQAGAEAISINGHRLTARTAIRTAGSAITVDYRSITSPYRIEAIGDPERLPGSFAQTQGASWLNYLKQNFGITWDLSRASRLSLAGDAGLGVQQARPAG